MGCRVAGWHPARTWDRMTGALSLSSSWLWERVLHHATMTLLSLHWAHGAGWGHLLESLGRNSVPDSDYIEICT